MFGKMLGNIVRVASLPVTIVEVAADISIGGDGSRRTIREVTPTLGELSDDLADGFDDFD